MTIVDFGVVITASLRSAYYANLPRSQMSFRRKSRLKNAEFTTQQNHKIDVPQGGL